MSVNIDNNTATISTNNDEALQLGQYGVVKLGEGKNANVVKEVSIRGALRYNKNNDRIEMCDGSTWIELGDAPDANPILWSMIL